MGKDIHARCLLIVETDIHARCLLIVGIDIHIHASCLLIVGTYIHTRCLLIVGSDTINSSTHVSSKCRRYRAFWIEIATLHIN